MSTTRGWMLGAAMLAAVACAPATRARTPYADRRAALQSPPAAAPVTIVNNNIQDVKVYVLRDGLVVGRLGTVTGGSTATFAARRMFFPDGNLTLLAVPIGGYGTAHSGSLLVWGGQRVTFTIESSLNLSSAMVR